MGPVGRGKEEPMNEQGVAERAFGLGKGEGNARWWGGGLATIKATGKETGGLYSVVEARYGCEIVGTPSGYRSSREQGTERSMNEGHASKTYGLGEGEGEAR